MPATPHECRTALERDLEQLSALTASLAEREKDKPLSFAEIESLLD